LIAGNAVNTAVDGVGVGVAVGVGVGVGEHIVDDSVGAGELAE
jgi:hypothetical protein